jgi:amino-acid N-acetyltransferase
MHEQAAPVIRPATPGDREAIERLLGDADLPTAGVADILVTRPADFFVVPDPDSDDLVAVAGLEVCCDNALLRSVAVRPAWRARGVGRELVERVVAEAERRGVRGLYLLTMTAEHYFPRFGFERVERDVVPGDIADTLEFRSTCPTSAVVMVRPVSAAVDDR